MASKISKEKPYVGIELPQTVEQAITLNAKNGNTCWACAITKDQSGIQDLTRWDKCTQRPSICMMLHLFDIKMGHFRCKARFAAGGHMTKAPAAST